MTIDDDKLRPAKPSSQIIRLLYLQVQLQSKNRGVLGHLPPKNYPDGWVLILINRVLPLLTTDVGLYQQIQQASYHQLSIKALLSSPVNVSL